VPELSQPHKSKLTIVTSKVNSSVQGEIEQTKTPTQNPMHIGQRKKWCEGLILLKIEPYASNWVKP
jgi:hypothetical protein